jgi:predicted secreted protein
MLGVAAACASALEPAIAQPRCSSPSDQAVFDIQALRSELMVLATGCQDDGSYNAFIHRYQPELLANDHAVDAYFKHRFGRSGQTEHDRFVTELANDLSQQGSQLGTDFCPRNSQIFHEVMALHGASDLPAFAAGKDLVPPSMAICTALETPSKAKAMPAKVLPVKGKGKPHKTTLKTVRD